MFTAIFQQHYAYLAGCALVALALAAAAWWTAHRLGSPHGGWWAGLAATLTAMLGVTFMGSGDAGGECVVNHDLLEPFHTTQGLWNLAMTVPLGLFAVLASRRPLPALVGVVSLPLAVEFTQGTVDGLGRLCDSADAEMNVLGGIAGAALALVALTTPGRVDWLAGAKAALFASAALLLIGVGVARPAVTFTHVDGTGLSTADTDQGEAVEKALGDAFGDRYVLGKTYDQPCADVPCTNVVFGLFRRDEAHPEGYGNGTLSWPDGERPNISFEDGDRPTVMGFPVPGAEAPSTGKEAYETARAYMRAHHPWAREAGAHETYPMGKEAEFGWTTRWTWTQDGVLMPRSLDVEVDRQGRVSQLDVTRGPARLDLEKAKLSAEQAERAVWEDFVARSEGRGVPDDVRFEAFALKAVERGGTWRPEWLVNLTAGAGERTASPPDPATTDVRWVDSLSGDVHNSAFGTGR
ncbi:VanZ family protein [Streptomyces sp. NK15101]|uniref:VanZ family protein n=1 Tax=Streptomyces sp. NK15101 TaxID=2873261 RepID=UPI001CED73EA|nr:VanZ family protein [Streptomyces sp. NK15101]